MLIIGLGINLSSRLQRSQLFAALSPGEKPDIELRTPLVSLLHPRRAEDNGSCDLISLAQQEGELRLRLRRSFPGYFIAPDLPQSVGVSAPGPLRFLRAWVATTAVFVALIWAMPEYSIEQSAFTWFARVGYAALCAPTLASAAQLVAVWQWLRRLLDRMSAHPVLETLRSLKPELSNTLAMHPFRPTPSAVALLESAARRQGMADGPISEKAVRDAALQDPEEWWQGARSRARDETAALLFVLELGKLLVQLREFAARASAGALILVLWHAFYPFDPTRRLDFICIGTVLFVTAATLYVFVDMKRNAVLSIAAGEEAGGMKWDLQLVLQLVLYAAVPIAGLMLGLLPQLGLPVLKWLLPILRSAKLGA